MNWSTKAIVALICVLAAVTILATDASGENREVIIDESGTCYIQPFLYYSGTATGVPEGTAILVDLGDNGSLSRAFTKTDADGRVSCVFATIYDSLDLMYGDLCLDLKLHSKSGTLKYRRNKEDLLMDFI